MKVSVLMITFNHERFIAQALDSVLMQEVSFDFEIVIGEDCSTDNTRHIILDYQQLFPSKVKVLLHRENVGAIPNLIQTYKACVGDYIALLEGDDYWTSPRKLQIQADFLDSNPKYVISCHAVEVFDENKKAIDGMLRPYQGDISVGIEELMAGNFIPTCSSMFRNRLFGEFPDWFFAVKQGDWPLHVLNATKGQIRYVDKPLAVYRVHSGGVWSSESIDTRIKYIIHAYEVVNSHFNYKYDRMIQARITKFRFNSAEEYEKNGNIPQARKIYSRYLFRAIINRWISMRQVFRLFLKLYIFNKRRKGFQE